VNRFPVWKYIVIALAMVFGLIYTLPNFFGESPAVQVSSAKATVKVDSALLGRIEQALTAAAIKHQGIALDTNSIKVRLPDTDTQLKAKDVVLRTLNPDLIVICPGQASEAEGLTSLTLTPSFLLI
jgi:preprotein translocase subunit SecD